jgi:hypothetical protein
VALLIFYGALLLITPAFSGLVRGRLPIEISTSGAKFAAEAERTTELDEVAIRKLEETTTDLHRALATRRPRPNDSRKSPGVTLRSQE